MSQYKKIVVLSLVVVSSGFNGISFGGVATDEMSILPVFDESGKVVDTPMGRLDQVRAARSGWGKHTLPESEREKFDRGEDRLRRQKEREKKMVERRSKRREAQLEDQEIQAKINVMMEKIAAWHNDLTMKKAGEINASDIDLRKKLRKLKKLANFVNQEFDKLDYVKNPGKYTPAQISEQEDVAFSVAVKNMEEAEEKWKLSGKNRHHGHRGGEYKRRRVKSGCPSGTCSVTNN